MKKQKGQPVEKLETEKNANDKTSIRAKPKKR